MKLAIIGNYSEEQLDYCIKSVFGQCNAEFDVIFACCDTKYKLAYLIHTLNLHENKNIRNIFVDRNYESDFNMKLNFVMCHAQHDNVLFLLHGTALYDVKSIEKCSKVAMDKDIKLVQNVLYNSDGTFIEVSPLIQEQIYDWNNQNTHFLSGVIVNTDNYSSWLKKKLLANLLQLRRRFSKINLIPEPVVKVEISVDESVIQQNETVDLIVDWYNISSVEDYCKKNGIVIHTAVEEGKGKVYEPSFFRCNAEAVYLFDRPKVYWTELSEVEVLSESGIIIKDGKALCDEFAFDAEVRNNPLSASMIERNQDEVGLMYQQSEEVIDKAICLLNWASVNYYHLTLETVSKLAFLNTINDYDDYVLLVDEIVLKYQQFQDLVGMMQKGRTIKYIKAGQSVYINKMIYVSPTSWMPIRLLNRSGLKDSDSVIVEEVIFALRKAASAHIREKTKRKIFISRKNTINIRMENEDEIASLFEEMGFEVVQTETMSLQEQIECFSSAGCIVGASGAAFTNIIYCNPKTVVGCIKARDVRFFKYSTIAYYLGLKVLFADCKVVEYSNQGSSDVREMDIEYCRDYIKELISLME